MANHKTDMGQKSKNSAKNFEALNLRLGQANYRNTKLIPIRLCRGRLGEEIN